MKTLLNIMMLTLCISYSAIAQDAKEIIRKAYEKTEGESNQSVMSMTIIRPQWQRTLSFKAWNKGTSYSMVLITEPVKEKGQTFLKRNNEMWNWMPSIGRMVKLPPSMLSQGWMGSDYTNDDMMKENSIVEDYDHSIIGSEVIEGKECYKIKMIPKAETAIVWGSIIKWISKADYLQLKSEFYDEENELVKTEIAGDIKTMDNRIIPTRFEIIPADTKGNKTIVNIIQIKFNVKIEDSFFSQQNMKTIR